MPTYVYACKNCGHQFEQYQSFSDDALSICPQCEQESLRKVFNSVGIVFKGSGFYRTDSQAGSVDAGSQKSSDSSGSDSSTSSGDAAASGASEKSAAPKTSSGTSAGSGSSTGSAAASA